MDLQLLWFVIIAFFWAGYFVLEGFDFGVGMLLPFVGKDDRERHELLETIGPVWDGNEVWLVVAAGATFAAFPAWYGTMFSGFYLALLLVLVLLILRVVSFEWRNKSDDARWQRTWLGANVVGSVGAPFLWGIALSNLLRGVPIDSDGHFDGSFWDLFSVYTVFAGLVTVVLFAFHGAIFLALKRTGELELRAAALARRLAVPAAVAGAAFALWTVAIAVDRNDKDAFPPLLPALLAVVALALAVVFMRSGRSGRAFAMTAVGIASVVATLFVSLYPRVMVSSTDFANSLTVDSTSSSHYALGVMTVAALILTPMILLYQGWTYHVFRARLGGGEEPSPPESDLVPRETGA
jgi:cytochrome bd ubiquinol oxidase subunit II